MERVLQNLVVNAVAYTRVGGRIVVRLERDEKVLLFKIRNEGQALADDILDWYNYNDLMPPAKPAIGLSIVQRALEMHGFRFGAVADAGWNEFWISMPVVG
jgi:signal transduction histidine kinase